MNKKKIVLSILIGCIIFGAVIVLLIGPSRFIFWTKQSIDKLTTATAPSSTYGMEIVYDGDHYKIDQPIKSKDNQLYIALSDLEMITELQIEERDQQISITYQDNHLFYQEGAVQNDNWKKGEIKTNMEDEDTIYLPESHIEKYLGIEVDYYLDEKTKTISLLSPQEQQLEPYDQEIGTTILLHQEDVPLAKYEPRDGIYLGGYVIQDEHINANMDNFNELARKQHASYFRYVGYGQPFPKDWVNEVIAAGGFPQIAWEPNNGLEEVKDDDYLRQFAKDAKAADVPILLRYASEMNGTWTAYSGDPELYLEKWKLVHDIMEEEAPNVMMLWNVFTMPENTIDDYYPGDEYVDYVGVNIYNVVYHNDNLEEISDFEDPLRLLDYVYNKYSDTKPIVIGEFGATNYTVTDGLYHVDFAVEKITRMYTYLPTLYPRVKFIYYFDVNNLVNAPEGRKINNYAITENPRITNAYSGAIQDSFYLSEVQQNASTEETFSYRDFLFYYQKELFVDIQFVRDYLGMKVEESDKDEYEVTYQGETHTINGESLTIDKAAFFEKRTIQGISLDAIIEEFNVKHDYTEDILHLYQ
ncbi:glycoside hydrolase family 26 protein [Ornithinibacillus xuwenensis]|uniref:Glycosyl hydrolase n=1 Tax=Ornithinibacillus xuwenensis TaxID=3144668 RepID=A0ABU9XJN8_9BACI